MSQNPNGAQECSVEVFGGWVTETAPENLPVGVSPDCPDNTFAPGQVGTRGGLARIFNPPLEPNATITYGKSFVTPTGTIKNLYLSSLGNFYLEDLTLTPGTATLLFTTTPGTYAKSISCFGREYIAISDGLHGQDVPLQYDGTFVDRVTQDGPGAPPIVTSLALPPVALAHSAAPTPITITTIVSDFVPAVGFGIYATATTSTAHGLTTGQSATITGNSYGPFNGTYAVIVVSPTVFSYGFFSTGSIVGNGGVLSGSAAGITLTRAGNTVSGATTTAHNLQVGYQALIAGVAASQVGGGITSVVVDNEDLPGIATITTAEPHGLVPENDVFLDGIPPTMVTIASFSYTNFVADVITLTPHGLSVGSSILLSLGAGGGAGTPETVTAVLSPTEFITGESTGGASSGSGGFVKYVFPLATTITTPASLNTETYEVIAAPTPTTFQIAFEYTDGTWTGGTVSFAWNGTFFVTAVPTPTTFQYQQYGPNATTNSDGTLTPYGQAAPGLHQLRMSFLTRQGYLTRPSPFVTFVANGGQYISVTNMAIGPSNIVARVLELTGALGSRFFYLPVAAQVNGLVVSTATQVNDNTTTSVLLDLSDNTLYAGIGTSVPGNNTAAQIVLDGALGFTFSSTRLGTYGQRNRLQSLLSMGFEGGTLPSAPLLPAGWTAPGGLTNSPGGTLVAGRFNGEAWQIDTGAGPGTLSQSFYEDVYGAPIATGATLYKVRYYVTGNGTFQAEIASASTGFTATATINANGPGWYEATFTNATPQLIPTDMLYTISGISGLVTVDDGSVIYANSPYLDTVLYDSYVSNPEAFDGVTGKFGPSQDTHKVMAAEIVRGNLCLLTQDPSGRLHEVIDNGTTEPAGWDVNEIAANCGVLSTFATTVSQADDSTASGGEEWMAWASESGARIWGGGDVWKISQEIQPNWYDPEVPATVGAGQINMAVATTAWALNDPVERVVYFGLPLAAATAPLQVYTLNYREMDDAYTIAHSPPFHPSLSGKLIATDNTRKWSPWNRSFNGAARMYRSTGELTTCFFAGNGTAPGAGGFGNLYRLDPALSTDDDYGAIGSYYVTCALPTHDQEQGLGLGSQKKILATINAFFTCVGSMTFTIFRNQYIAGPPYQWPISFTRPSATYFDMEMPGGNVEANRMFFKWQPVPAQGQTDARYLMERFIPFLRKAKVPQRGSAY